MGNEKWHTKSVEEVIGSLHSNEKGLDNWEAKNRLQKYGYNLLKGERRIETLSIFLRQFKSYFLFILFVAAVVSFVAGRVIAAYVILILVALTVALGFIQEYRAERAIQALKRLLIPKAKVLRNGILKEISSRKLVPGDIVLLQSGDKVPADARIVESTNLRVDESALTGESIPINKQASILNDVPLAERTNMVFMGTIVVYGKATVVVVATGSNTELGKIASMIREKEPETPLQVKLTQFSKWLGIFVLILSVILFSTNVLIGEPFLETFLIVASLAVASIPEVLPTMVTATLAIGVRRMAKNNAIIRKLSAVETLGSVTVICADKTGTITTNEMTVRKIYINKKNLEVTGAGFEPVGKFVHDGKDIEVSEKGDLGLLFKASVLCNDAKLVKDDKWHVIGDPTEGALLTMAAKANVWQEDTVKSYPRIAELPFSSERQMMTTIHSDQNKTFAYVKGAPEAVLKISSHIKIGNKVNLLGAEDKERILEIAKDMAGSGLRVLAIAYKTLQSENFSSHFVEKELVFVGLIGMYDPPRPEVKQAIQTAKEAGIKTVMLTGDHLSTALFVAREVGLIKDGNENFLVGDDLDKMSDEKFESLTENVLVYARVSPEHKLRIVKTLKKKGHVVAVTGDGVNDAPALKFADIGVAMGIKGTEVAKEASNMVLTDDNFATIVKAVEEGRGIYDNLRKFIRYLLTINLSEIFLVSIASFARLPLPLLPLQILWLNLVTDGPPAFALSVDPNDPETMKRKPRNPKLSILHGMKLFLIAAGSVALLTEFFVFSYSLYVGSSIEKARTMVFTVGVMFQLLFVFNCRSENKSVLRVGVLSNKFLLLGIVISILMQLLVIYLPFFQEIFGTASLNLVDWLIVIALASSGLLVSPRIFMGYEKWNSNLRSQVNFLKTHILEKPIIK